MMKKLRDYQVKAVNAAVNEFKKASRCKVIMPCGTGKTLVGIKIREKLNLRRSLIVAPSLALVKQLLDAYAKETSLDDVFVVCSDNSTAKEAREIYDIPSVTTDTAEIGKLLRKRGKTTTVFCTYQSLPRIAECYLEKGVPKIDLAIFDEAHRMTGGGKVFTTGLDQAQVPVNKRLFMTATPRVALESARKKASDDDVLFGCMDDESQFGKEAFRMTLGEAINAGHLTDYQVAVFVIKEDEIRHLVHEQDDIREVAKQIAIIKAMIKYDLRKVIAYHSTVSKMRQFASVGFPRSFEAFKESKKIHGELWSESLDGNTVSGIRSNLLRTFGSLNDNKRGLLNNCKVLQEGVDCPSVDGIALVDSRSQPGDIVQIVGRAIRKSKDKKQAVIVLPVFMPDTAEEDLEKYVASSEFSQVWDVVNAIKSHDVEWTTRNVSSGKSESSGRAVPIDIHYPEAFIAKLSECVQARMLKRSESIQLTEDLVWQWMQEYFGEHGKFPNRDAKKLSPCGRTWSAINHALKNGYYGLPGGSSLAKLRKDRLDEKEIILTEDLVWRWMQEYFNEHKRWPNCGLSELTPYGKTWRAIDQSLQQGSHGLPGGSSLAKLRKDRLGEKEIILTEDLIWHWMQEFFDEHERWPAANTKELSPCGKAWMTINNSLKRGFRSLPGGSSLAKLRDKMLAKSKTLRKRKAS